MTECGMTPIFQGNFIRNLNDLFVGRTKISNGIILHGSCKNTFLVFYTENTGRGGERPFG